MYLYYDKNLNLRTKIDHGEKIRQGSDFEIVLCLDADFDFESKFNGITGEIVYNGNKIGSNVPSEYEGIEAFQKLYPNENTVDLLDGVSYLMYHFRFGRDPYTLNSGRISFVPTLSYYENENNEKLEISYKELTFGSADLFVEKTIGTAKQNIILTNNFYEEIEKSIKCLNAKKANKTDMSDEEIIVVDGKPVLVSKEFIDLINNEQLGENLDKINKLFEDIANKPTDLRVEILGESSVSYRSLKNTKWTFNDVINFENFVEKINLNFVSNFEGFNSINIAVAAEDAFVMLYDKTETYARIIGYSSFWTNTIYKDIEILGGEDVENIEVIAWFENNATCTSTPNDSIKYSLVLTGNTLTLTGTDGTRSSVTLNYPSMESFENASQKITENETQINSLKTRVLNLENSAPGTGETITSKYVVNTVNNLLFNVGRQETVHNGDLLVSLETVNGITIAADELRIGDVIYNRQLNQPDLWVSEIIEVNISNVDLTNSKWILSDSFPEDANEVEYNLTFTSNGEQFVKIVYNKVLYSGLVYIKSNGDVITVYNVSDGTWNDENYKELYITGGADTNNLNAINWFKGIGRMINYGIETYAQISILETERVDLEDYLKTTDVVYVDNLAGQLDVDTVGTLTIKGVEHKIKVKKVSGSGTGLTSEQESLLNNLVVESNSGYTAGTQRMIGMVYENIVDSQATKGFLVGLPIPSISFTQKVTSGIEIGTLTINGVNVKIYIPTSSGPGVTEERVQEMIDNSLVEILKGDY